MSNELQTAPEINLLKSEMEAAAARVAERAMNTTLDGVVGFVGDVFGGLFGDSIKQWRTRRLVTALIKTKEHLEAAGIAIENAKALPMGEVYAIFEGASKQEDVDLTAMWAALLSNAMNPVKDTFIDPSFTRILNDLSGLDARILNYTMQYRSASKQYRDSRSELSDNLKTSPQSKESEQKSLRKIDDEFRCKLSSMYDEIYNSYAEHNISYSISNLLRLGLIYEREPAEYRSELLEMSVDQRRGRIVLNDAKLKGELRKIKEKLDIPFERRRGLYDLSRKSRFQDDIPFPNYDLSGLGERFMAACV